MPNLNLSQDQVTPYNDNGNNSLLSLVADIGVKLGNLHKKMDDREKLRRAASRYSQPVFFVNSDQCTVVTGGIGVVRLAGPDQGHIWYPQGINFFTPGANGVETAMPGKADVFISGADQRSKTSLAQFSPVDWRDTIASLPNVVHYSRSQITQRFNEELYVAFSGATVGLQYGATVWTLDFEEAAVREGYTL